MPNLRQYISWNLRTAFFHWIKSTRNKSLYTFAGVRRSGNHAIIHWMMRNMSGCTSFCNDVWLNQDPSKATLKKMKLGINSRRNVIISYEDRLPDFSDSLYNSDHVGHISNQYHIIILRDQFNLFASRMSWKYKQGTCFKKNVNYRKKIIDIWKSHALQFLEWEQGSESSAIVRVPINFNEWYVNKHYRKTIGQQLALDGNQTNVGAIHDYGGGSSFDGMNVRAGKQLDVLCRYKNLLQDHDFKSIFEDKELITLSTKIFGHIPGTDVLYR